MVNARYSCSQGFNCCDCWHNSLLRAIDIGVAIDGCIVVFIIFFFSLWAEFLFFHSTDHLLALVKLSEWLSYGIMAKRWELSHRIDLV